MSRTRSFYLLLVVLVLILGPSQALAAPEPISLDQEVSGAIELPGGEALYALSNIPSGTRVYLDRLTTNNVNLLNWLLHDAYGRTLASNLTALNDLGPLSLMGGDYTLTVRAETAAATGTYSFVVRPVADTSSPLALNSPDTRSITGAGAQHTYSLALAEPAVVHFVFTSLSNAGLLNYQLTDTHGNLREARTTSLPTTTGAYALSAGVHKLEMFGEVDFVGGWTVEARRTQLATVPIALDTPVSFSSASVADELSYTFQVPETTRVFLDVVSSTSASNGAWRLERDDGFALFDWTASVVDNGPLSLAPANYTLRVRSKANAAVSGIFSVKTINDTNSQLEIDVPTPISITSAGQIHTFSLADVPAGTYGIWAVSTTNSAGLNWLLTDSEGRDLVARTTSLTYVEDVPLLGGDYSLSILGEGDATGTVTVRLVPITSTTTAPPFPGTITDALTTPGERRHYTFSANAGQRITIDSLTSSNTAGLNYVLHDSAGRAVVARTTSLSDTLNIDLMGGSYTLTVLGEGPAIGTYSIALLDAGQSSYVPEGESLALGEQINGVLQGSQPIQYTLHLSSTTRVFFDLTTGAVPLRWSFFDPAGRSLFLNAVARFTDSDDRGPFVLLPGTYVLQLADPTAANVAYGFRILETEVTEEPITLGQTISATPAAPGFLHRYVLDLPETTWAFFDVELGNTNLYWQLTDSAGALVFSRVRAQFNDSSALGPFRLAPGTYTLDLDTNNGASPAYSFRILTPSVLPFNLSLSDAPADFAGTFATPGDVHEVSIEVLPGQSSLHLDLTSGFSQLRWSLFDPSGQPIFQNVRAWLPADEDRGPYAAVPGTYRLVLDPIHDFVGSYGFTLRAPSPEQEIAQLEQVYAWTSPPSGSAKTFMYNITGVPQRAYFDLLQAATGVTATFTHVETGWQIFTNALLNNITTRDQGPFTLPPGTYTLTLAATSLTGTVSWRIGAAEDTFAGKIPFNTLQDVQIGPPGSTLSYHITPTMAGQALTFDLMSTTTNNLWTLIDPVGEAVFPLVAANNWNTHDRGPFSLASGTYTLLFDPANDATPNFQFRVSAPIEVVDVPDGCASCKALDIAFLFDTSGSMTGAAANLCALASNIAAGLAEEGIPIKATYWGLTNTANIPCVNTTVVAQLGGQVPGDPPPNLANLATCVGGGTPDETWSLASAIVAERYPWTDGAVKLVIPVGDEGPYCGDPVNQSDYDAILWARHIASQAGVVVSPLIPNYVGDPIVALGEILAAGTGGVNTVANFAPEAFPATVKAIGTAACETVQDAAALPTFTELSPMPGSLLPAGVPLVLSGRVLPVNALRPVLDVQVNGNSAGVLDATGSFFATVTLAPGPNTVTVTAVEACGPTALSLELTGVDESESPWSGITEVSLNLQARFAGTTYDFANGRLLASVQAENQGAPLVGPLLMAVGTDLDPAVSLLAPDGTTPNGEPFVMVLEAGQILEAGALSSSRALAFSNPQRQRNDFTVRWLAPANQAPYFTSAPKTKASVGTPWSYEIQTGDGNGDHVALALLVGPTGMQLDGSGLSWTPSAAGTYDVVVRASDGKGGLATQSFAILVKTAGANEPPFFVTPPAVQLPIGLPYAYAAKAFDPDGDVLTYSLPIAPAGMVVGSGSGLVSWPQPIAGQHAVSLRVEDGAGGLASQSFTLFVGEPAMAAVGPVILSTPEPFAAPNTLYRYAVVAADPDSPSLDYTLADAPAGMQIHPLTGLLEWIPNAGQLGPHAVVVQVSDEAGHLATQGWTINVLSSLPNQPPYFTTTPPLTAVAGQSYTYAASAVDPEFESLTFSVTQGPIGFQVDPQTGIAQWSPEPDQAGIVWISLLATDPAGASATQTFSIQVKPANAPPLLLASPAQSAWIGETYTAVFTGIDPDADPLAFTLVSGPPGMKIDAQTGLLWWPTSGQPAGLYPAEVKVSDPFGGFDTRAFLVNLQADTQAPKVQIFATKQPICAGETVSLCISASDNVGVVSRALALGGAPLELAGNCASITPSAIGVLSASGTATDPAGNVGVGTANVQVANCNDTQKPVVDLISPAAESVHSGPTNVVVNISDDTPEALTWTVSLARGETGAFVKIAEGIGSVSNAAVASFDPTMLPNDGYRVQIIASDGLQTGGLMFWLHAAGSAKPGRFSFSVNDLTIPVAGIPLSVGRVYDSLEAGPFGAPTDLAPGWKLQLAGNVSDTRGDGNPNLPAMAIFTPEPFTLATRVYVTRPDGRRVGFTFAPKPKSFPALFQYTAAFEPDEGVDDELKAVDGPTTVWSYSGVFYDYIIPYNPTAYALTTKEGVTYTYSETKGLIAVEDVFGNTLTVTASGIKSSLGPELVYVRDSQNRIVQVVEPEPEDASPPGALTYAYSAQGNLVAFAPVGASLSNGATTYQYTASDLPHYLTAVVDPLGNVLARNIYDEDGRLVAVCPAGGDPITLEGCNSFAFDVSGGLTTVFDARGQKTELFYDVKGRLSLQREWLDASAYVDQSWTYDNKGRTLSYTDGEGGLTTYAYDSAGNEISRTLPSGEVWTWTWGSCRNHWLSACDPLGNCTSQQLDTKCNVRFRTDPLGGITEMQYDAKGRNIATIDPLGQALSMTYDSKGRPTSVTDSRGLQTTFSFNAKGELASLTDRAGRVRQFTYDASHRVLTETWLTGQGPMTTSWTYNAAGLVERVESPESTMLITYWPTGKVKRVSHEAPGAPSWWVEYAYDPNGNVLRATDSTGALTDYGYDPLDHIASVMQSGPGVSPKRVDLEVSTTGLPLSVARFGDTAGNIPGPITTYNYTCAACASGLSEISHMAPSGASIHQLTYQRDAAKQITALTDAEGAHTYAYDGRGWLLAAAHAPASGLPNEFYTWDAAGNWLQTHTQTAPAWGYATGPGGHLLHEDADFSYIWSPTGALLSRTHKISGETIELDWDFLDRLTGAMLLDDQGNVLSQASYGYAPTGWRVRAEIDGSVRHIGFDGQNATFALDPQGQVVWRRLHTRSVDRPLAEEIGGQTRWFLADHVGTVRDIVSTAGAPLAHFTYSAFGEQLSGPAPTIDDAVRFTGREFDIPGGLGYFRARAYDPGSARFVSEDMQAPWHYRYADNNPLSRVDPSGQTAAIEYALLLCDVLANVSFALAVNEVVQISFGAVADGLAGKPVDAEAVRKAVLRALYNVVSSPIPPCGLPFPGPEFFEGN